MTTLDFELYGEDAMEGFGERLAKILLNVNLVNLNGNLGMGKTTLVRGLLKGLGHIGPVKSPTYTIVEPYELDQKTVFHFDLYRVGDPEELEFMGIRDYFENDSLCLVEWPEMGEGCLPMVDVNININLIRGGREVILEAVSEKGIEALKGLNLALAS
ncbi:tRNA (adenosine(37)-N6)-threonylcarbamoyltransferase complex ATPase subunit type 1 TsaE [Marinomonas sp. 42_23_T18]|nr:tRNA (adenosine(37)-N6)-threonylcarbamoyltransferase complex ATPase subunit type 1 TsaE [Marinomonas sp. 42_23_T18]